MTGELKKLFRPEFLNRVDEVIVFHDLTREEIEQIVDLMVDRLREQLVPAGHRHHAHRGRPQAARQGGLRLRRSAPVRCGARSSGWSRTRSPSRSSRATGRPATSSRCIVEDGQVGVPQGRGRRRASPTQRRSRGARVAGRQARVAPALEFALRRAARPPAARRASRRMAKARTVWRCQTCGASAPRWQGRCSECGEFGTMVEEIEQPVAGSRRAARAVCRPAAARRGRSIGGHARLHRHRRARPRARRRARARLARAARRGAGHRQVDAAAAGGGRARAERDRGALRVRRGVAAADRDARQAARRCERAGALLPELDIAAVEDAVRERSPACSWSTRSRRPSIPSLPARRAASGRCARAPRG